MLALGLVGCALVAGTVLGPAQPEAGELARVVNAYRANHGRVEAVWDAGLARAAAWKAQDLDATQRFAHTDSRGRYPGELLLACGYHRIPSGWGEALARAYPTPEAVLAAFLRSAPHRTMLERRDYAALGAARAGVTWVLYLAGDLDVPLE
jgi:uncharacterized protein YkwD